MIQALQNIWNIPDLKKRIGFTPQEEELLVNPDLEFLSKRMAELKDFWDKQFVA